MASLKDAFEKANAAIEKNNVAFDSLAEVLQKLTSVTEGLIKAKAGETEEQKKEREAKERLKAQRDKEERAREDAIKSTKQLALSLVGLANGVAISGIKFASAIGTTATAGVQLEIKNRLAIIAQLADFTTNQAISFEQLKATQAAYANLFIGAREGFQLSSEGARQFAQNLKGGFKSEFELTDQSLRALITAGVSTRDEFEQLRAASGRAGLAGNQLANIVNKNSLSFLVFGNSFARAAADADKLGISLSAVQAQQEAYVTNLDGAIDTVAQLNQIGATLDFGTLTKLQEMGDPAKVLAYINANTQALNFNMSSIRALAKGITNPEDLLKLRGKPTEAADNIQKQLEEQKKSPGGTGAIAAGLTGASKIFEALGGMTMLNTAMTTANTIGLIANTSAQNAQTAVMLKQAGLPVPGMSALGKLGIAAGVVGGVATGTAIGTSMGASTGGSLVGAGIGTALGAAIGSIIAPGIGTAIGAQLGGMAGGSIAGVMSGKKGDDVVSSPGYGDRQLVTPTGTIALNNNDTVMAGTNLLSKGALSPDSNAGTTQLHAKLDNLITTLNNATTTINVDGQTSTVPRMSVTGVYTRSEKR
jgi:hypothetical protein